MHCRAKSVRLDGFFETTKPKSSICQTYSSTLVLAASLVFFTGGESRAAPVLFSEPAPIVTGLAIAFGSATADIDGDGDLDVLRPDPSQTNKVLFNQ